MGAFIPERNAGERSRTPRTTRCGPWVPTSGIETDGGQMDDNALAFSTYTDDEYGYSLAYPTDWTVERDSDGTTFEAPRSSAGAVVFVEEGGLTPKASAVAFLADLADDEHVHALDVLTRREIRLKTGQTGRIIECAYVGDSHKRWRLSYLFVAVKSTGYTVGVDWSDAVDFETVAARIVESFAVEENRLNEQNRSRKKDENQQYHG